MEGLKSKLYSDGTLGIAHENMDIIIDIDTRVVHERVFVRVYGASSVVKTTPEKIELVWRKLVQQDDTWKLEDSPDVEMHFFYRKYPLALYPTKTYMHGVISWFQWYFHTYDIYNLKPTQ